MAQSHTTLTFKLRRLAPELIVPAKPTPRELKPLSDNDDQGSLRFHIPLVHLYHENPKMRTKNPASVIREALAKVLVFYYPLAGRLKEGPTRKLMVDCTGEGVLFIEAEADVTLKQFGEGVQLPFPCMKELLYDVPGSSGILDAPLLLIQRVAFCKRSTTCEYNHRVYDEVADNEGTAISSDDMTQRSFFFGPAEVTALRRFAPMHLQHCTTFDVLTASIWRCRTIALQPNPKEDMRIICVMDARSKFNPPIPLGYYGNVLAFATAISTAQDLCNKPLSHALELVMKAKSNVTEEYMRSIADLMVIKRRPRLTKVRSYSISNLTHAGFEDIDFGWGKAIYAGPSEGIAGDPPGRTSFYIPFYNTVGEGGVLVPICLPSVAMNKFVNELNNMLQDNDVAYNNQALQEHKLRTLSKI
ncbi:benzyl alcohol O-benzoyltransferase [Artemisia annua]|uniref:Benzyl alcohol O-benzoyltransferase n=1 Tax=Artemisia annua TaxID=35608 RepID=A0A2U1PIH8_ARTAN|nr:benzyl alcohol O-benzoyltransferase [Artemisia annua]